MFQAGEISDKTQTAAKLGQRKPMFVNDEDAGLVGQLKAVRLTLAQAKNVPAYVIFPDRTLLEIAAQKPVTKQDFLAVNGVGPKKVEAYFDEFSAVITRYLAHQDHEN